ncbi:MAG: chromosome segregation protein SMC [Candidatus Omnitrophica bacterium]|nr:chromosome segregation protein SMC [Candidatus Omnitrophota bacterium]
MYFKGIEVIGFKSFLNKTKFKFEPGVTAVVGPNGCGKSNVVDAIKWVLGEQSVKSMRAGAMQDVIFNGTENHQPVNVAEVSLMLSNTDRALSVDYDEVTITRRLYRSGESEYLLNKTPVRLTDIRNLIMGTGIGTSSYSIVEQGRMDMILSSKPEERRYIFEEASGITRYKSKKREALLKLERTQENLVRINDITREVERQINSIERKARKAERYKTRYEELKELDLKLAARTFKEQSASDAYLAKENEELVKQIGEIRGQLEKASFLLAGCKENHIAAGDELQSLQNEQAQFEWAIDKNTRVIEINAERTKELEKNAERLNWEIGDLAARREKLEKRLTDSESKFSSISTLSREKNAEFKAISEEAKEVTTGLEKYRHQLKFDREKTVDMFSKETNAKNSLIKVNADIQNTELRSRRLRAEKAKVVSEKEKVYCTLKETRQDKELLEKNLEDKKQQFDTFSREYIERREKLDMLNEKKSDKEKRLNEISIKRRFLEKLLTDREGISDSVKDIMKQVEGENPRFIGVRGILSELVNLNEEYEESVKFILREASQALVVDSHATAREIIEYLEKNEAESVNFIILDELKSAYGDRERGGKLKDITCVLDAEEPYSTALKVFLNDVSVFFHEGTSSLEIETEGTVIGKNGEVRKKGLKRSRNFSGKENIPLFGRSGKIDKIKEEEKIKQSEIEKVETVITEIKEWFKTSDNKKEKLESELNRKQMDFMDISSKRSALKEKLNSFDGEVLLLDSEIEEENKTIEKLTSEKEELTRILSELKTMNVELEKNINETQNFIQENSRKREELFFKIADVKSELSVFIKEEENLKENLEMDRSALERMSEELKNKNIQKTESIEKIKTLSEESETLKSDIARHKALIESKSEEVSQKEELKVALAEKIRSEEEKLKTKEVEQEVLKDKARDGDIRKKELEYKRNGLVEKINETYKTDLTTFDIAIEENTDWEDIKSRVKGLKEQLEKMGEVSLDAVEEHRQLEERFRFLTKQREDLVSGRESLLQAISKINRTTKKLFLETFESIKKEFNTYFKMLFAGGRAELVLEDESDILECGINIVVRPPGKKLHNIMQLSGGEKAMTAIALIFAIFKVNPSPFCILDEIDAPLDESNIVRFCNVLQEFIKLSQFVIVTHNRMTIQLADVLYGITMEEKGVSKVVSVKFAEEQKSADTETVPVGV